VDNRITAAAAAASGNGKDFMSPKLLRRYSGTITHLPPEVLQSCSTDSKSEKPVGVPSSSFAMEEGDEEEEADILDEINDTILIKPVASSQDVYAFGVLMHEVMRA
jgi:serine/threonine protein kinase